MNSTHYDTTSYLFLLLFAWSSCCYFSSCGPYLYAPTDSNLLELKDKGDIKAGASLGAGFGLVGNRRTDINAQIAYSPIKNLGIQASGSLWGERVVSEQESFRGPSSLMGDLAIGFYQTLNKKTAGFQKGNTLVWRNYVGLGGGDLNHSRAEGNGYKVNYHKYFIQSQLSWNVKDKFSVSFFVQPTWLDYQSATVFGGPSYNILLDIEGLKNNSRLYHFESGFRLQGGGPKAQLYWSCQFSSLSVPRPSSFIEIFSPNLLTTSRFGVVFSLDKIFFKKKSKAG